MDRQNFEALFQKNGVSGHQNGFGGISPNLVEIRKKFKGQKLLDTEC